MARDPEGATYSEQDLSGTAGPGLGTGCSRKDGSCSRDYSAVVEMALLAADYKKHVCPTKEGMGGHKLHRSSDNTADELYVWLPHDDADPWKQEFQSLSG